MDLDRAVRPVPSRAWLAFLAGGLACVGGYALLPANGVAAAGAYALVNGAAAVAVAVGIRWGRPLARLAWRLVLTAVLFQFALNALEFMGGLAPALALPEQFLTGAFLVPHAVLAAALVAFAMARRSTADRTSLLDAAIIVVGIAVGSFLLATAAIAPLEGSALAERSDAVTSFFIGVPSLALGTWLLLTPGPSGHAIGLLTLGVAIQSLGDGIFGLGPYLPFAPGPEPAWLASLVAFGAAALHPSVASRPSVQPPAFLRGSARFALLCAAILVPALGDLPLHAWYGQHRPFEFYVVSWLVMVLAVARIGGLLREVERRRAAEAASRAFAEELVATTPGVVVRGRQSSGTLEYASPALETVLGYRPEDVSGTPGWWPTIVHPDDRAVFLGVVREAQATGRNVTGEVRLRHADGAYRTILIGSVWEADPDGRLDRFTGTGLDVTDWRASQAELATTRGYLDDVIRSTPVVFMHGRGPDRVLDYISANVEEVLGYPPAAALGVPDWPISIIHPDDRETAQAAIAASIERHEERYEADLRAATATGEARTMLVVIRRKFAEDGTWDFTGTLLDITDRKAMEGALRQAKEEAEAANRAKSEFLSGISHELRTPLNAVLGFGQLLEQSGLAAEDRDSVEQIMKGGRRLLKMVDGVLDLARVDAGRLTLSIEPVDVDEVLHEAADLVRPSGSELGVAVALPSRSEPAVFVSADRQRLKHVIHNLLSNAVRYSPEGAAVQVAVSPGAVSGRWRIAVTDAGPGVPTDLLPRLFEPFERTSANARADGGGLGVGLALSARLLALMAGAIGVESVPGSGSTFWVELPASDAPPGPATDAAGSAEAGAQPPTSCHTLVYVEDNLANLGLVERVLARRPGTRLLAAMQGRLGFDLVRQGADLVLLDLHLPDISGEEVLDRLRKDERTRTVPVLVLSSNGDPRARGRLLGLGADGYLQKPLDVAEFLGEVDRLLGTRHADA